MAQQPFGVHPASDRKGSFPVIRQKYSGNIPVNDRDRPQAPYRGVLAVLEYGFGIAELMEEGKHLFREDRCCGYRFLMFPRARLSYFLNLHVAVFVILQRDRYSQVLFFRYWWRGRSMLCKS